MDKFKCCICGKEVEGFGNNPWPINKEKDARCCDMCNHIVTLERIKEVENER